MTDAFSQTFTPPPGLSAMTGIVDQIFAPTPDFGSGLGAARASTAVPVLERAKHDLNDRGNARRLRDALASELVYCSEWGRLDRYTLRLRRRRNPRF